MTAIGTADQGSATPVPPIPADLHALHLLLLASAGRLGRIVHVLADLGIADLLGDGARPVAELAAQTETHAPSLYRLLRCAASVGILAETDEQTFTLTPLAAGLCAAPPGSVLPLVNYSNRDIIRRPYDEMMHSIRTGQPAFDRVFGMPFYRYLQEHSDVARFFERFMRGWSQQFARTELARLGLERFSCLADLGGGDGYFLSLVLSRHSGMRGYLLDLPAVVANAAPVLAEHGVLDRTTIIAGDIFADPLPAACDAYLLKAVLHNWPDDEVTTILRRVRAAIADDDARLLIIEPVIAPANEWDFGKFLDIDMLVLFGGRERTLTEWNLLLHTAGFELVNEPSQHWTLLECRPT